MPSYSINSEKWTLDDNFDARSSQRSKKTNFSHLDPTNRINSRFVLVQYISTKIALTTDLIKASVAFHHFWKQLFKYCSKISQLKTLSFVAPRGTNKSHFYSQGLSHHLMILLNFTTTTESQQQSALIQSYSKKRKTFSFTAEKVIRSTHDHNCSTAICHQCSDLIKLLTPQHQLNQH